MNIGKNIKYLRQKQHLTQEQVAERLGVTYQSVSKWENDTTTPDIALLPEIASMFGVSIDALFSDEIIDCAHVSELRPLIKDDDVIRIVQMRGTKVLEVSPRPSPDAPPIEIAFPRNCNNSTQYFNVEIYGSVVSDGSINGDVVAHQSINCGGINGDVVCQQGGISCATINGDCKALGIACATINGDIAADRDVAASTITGDVSCQTIKDCKEIHAHSIKCTGDIHCDKIVYTD
ncbi:MAG: helix-turn-helix domain-containing protein [Clostridia bacterium]|nr:helix-turn-helix domain-containing protein [Clostridia bacterium]